MDATRQFRFTVYCPMDCDGYYDNKIQLTLAEAWEHYEETGCALYMACDALSMENNSCVLDFTDLTDNELQDVYRAVKGR